MADGKTVTLTSPAGVKVTTKEERADALRSQGFTDGKSSSSGSSSRTSGSSK